MSFRSGTKIFIMTNTQILNHFQQPSSKKVKWIGVATTTSRKSSLSYYSQCFIGNLLVTVGDFVLINNIDDPDNIATAYVAEVINLFDTGADDDSRYRATITWYTRVLELPAKLRPVATSNWELFQNTMNYDKEIELETVLDTIQVYKAAAGEEILENQLPKSDPYFVGRSFNGRKIIASEGCVGSEVVLKKQERSVMMSLENTELLQQEKRKRKKTLDASIHQRNLKDDKQMPCNENCHQLNTPEFLSLAKDNSTNNDEQTCWAEDNKKSHKKSFCLKKTASTLLKEKIENSENRKPSGGMKLEETGISSFDSLNRQTSAKKLKNQMSGLRVTPKSSKKRTRSPDLFEVGSLENSLNVKLKKRLRFTESESDNLSQSLVGLQKTPPTMKLAPVVVLTPEDIKACDKELKKKSSAKKRNPKQGRENVLDDNVISNFENMDVKTPSYENCKHGISKSDHNQNCISIKSSGLENQHFMSTNRSTRKILFAEGDLDKEHGTSTRTGITTSVKRMSLRPRINKSYQNLIDSSGSDDEDDEVDLFDPLLYCSETSEDEDEVDNSDKDDFEVKGRNKKGQKSANHSGQKKSAMPKCKKPVMKIHTLTPSLPKRLQQLNLKGSALEQARSRLHISAVPDFMPCREDEFADVYSFVRDKIVDGIGGCMYISGVPGTGKTATMHQVVSILNEEYESGNIPAFKFIELNGMKLTEPSQAYVQFLMHLTGQKATADHASEILEKRFNTADPRRDPILLLVDELDLLWTRKQSVMYNIFDWPTRKHSKLIVLAIANTMDLPERMLLARIASRMGLTRMTFQPYTFRQLQEIVLSRIKGIPAFDEDAIQLVARKVAALSGDARRALDICRRATELAELDESQANQMVTMLHVEAALEEMYTAPKIVAIRNASHHEKIFLRSVLAEFQRTGIEEAVFNRIYKQHVSLCRFEGVLPPTVSQVSSLCAKLSSYRLLLTEGGRADMHQKVRLNISQDDVLYALRTASKN